MKFLIVRERNLRELNVYYRINSLRLMPYVVVEFIAKWRGPAVSKLSSQQGYETPGELLPLQLTTIYRKVDLIKEVIP